MKELNASLSKRCLIAACFLVAIFFFVGPASAVPILYNELVDGDLPIGINPTLLLFGTGTNIVRGETSVINDPAGTDSDSFGFIVPLGTRLILGLVEAVDLIGNIIEIGWNFQDGIFTDQSSMLERLVVGSPGSASLTTTPHGAGTYYMVGGSFLSEASSDVETSSYEFRLEVEPEVVPEPPVSLLLAAGLVVLGVARRKVHT